MAAIMRTLISLSVFIMLQCSLSIVESRPLNPKKHTASPFKHHHHHSKNAIVDAHTPASLRELALGTHKAAREILPFPFSATGKHSVKSHHKTTWSTAHNPNPQMEPAAFGGAFSPDVVIPPSETADTNEDGFGVWIPNVPVHPAKGSGTSHEGFYAETVKTTGTSSKSVEDTGFGAWGAFQPVRHAEAEDERFGGNSRAAGGTSKAIHLVPGEPPRIVEESIHPGCFGTFISSESSDDTADTSEDGWFMSVVPYPQPSTPRETVQTESSSLDPFAGAWGLWRDRRSGCDDDIVGRQCSSNADCRGGCNGTFECSTSNKCQRV